MAGWADALQPEEPGPDWVELIAEARIEEALKEGVFENLPGKGRPLELKEYPFVPPHLRVPYKILHDAGLAPGWIQWGKTLAELEERVRQVTADHLEWLAREGEAQARLRAQGRPEALEDAETRLAMTLHAHRQVLARVRSLLEARNETLDQYNRMVPNILWQKGRWPVEERLQRFEEACRAAFPLLDAGMSGSGPRKPQTPRPQAGRALRPDPRD